MLFCFRTGGWEMSRTVARLPAGSRIADYISLGVVAKTFPLDKIHAALAANVEGERAAARPARSRSRLLRNRAGVVSAAVLPASAALSAGGDPVAAGRLGGNQWGG